MLLNGEPWKANKKKSVNLELLSPGISEDCAMNVPSDMGGGGRLIAYFLCDHRCVCEGMNSRKENSTLWKL